ncbi:MAG TPA: serine/threonine-protein kinase, partial [Kofleriaceae bacterium]
MDPQSGAEPDLLLGQTVGNYRVTEKIGEGGMGSVYLAEHPQIGKKVALKVLHAEFATNPEVVERFFNEAKSVNVIGHPNIVEIIDYGVIQTNGRNNDQLVYFIMEYLHGQTLSQIIRTESPLPPERALMVALQVGDALAASHRQGIVHRDLKPDNIILIQRGREVDFVKLLDFGIAKLTASGSTNSKTRTGTLLGTPAYMSPEQCEGSGKVDHRTDIYALGIVLYEMLVGRVPFIGEGYGDILIQHLTQRPVEPSRYRMMSPHVEQVVLKALEKRPDMRYPNMDEMIRAMADPVGYVESHGGVGGFLQRQLTPSTAPLPSRLTPSPLTPMPGHHIGTPPPGSLLATPSPTTLSAATGVHAAEAPKKSKLGYIIAGGLVIGAAIAGVAITMNNSKKPTQPAGQGSDNGSAVVMNGSNNAMTVEHPDAAVAMATPDAAVVVVAIDAQVAVVTPPDAAVAVAPPDAGVVVAATSTITVTSNPPDAEIFVAGVSTGKKTPATLTLPRGKVAIGLRLKGYD